MKATEARNITDTARAKDFPSELKSALKDVEFRAKNGFYSVHVVSTQQSYEWLKGSLLELGYTIVVLHSDTEYPTIEINWSPLGDWTPL